MIKPASTGLEADEPPLRVLALRCGAAMLAALPLSAMAGAGVDPWVEEQLQRNERVEFIVRLRARAQPEDLRGEHNALARRTRLVERLRRTAVESQADLRRRLEQLGVAYRPYWISNAIWIEGSRPLLEELRQRDDVANIHANPRVRMDLPRAEPTPARSAEGVEWNIDLIGAPEVWKQGFTGQGAVVGGQDTGYQWDHPALLNQYRGWDGASADHHYNWHDAIHVDNPACDGDSLFPCDDSGHGTHTMGSMVGDDGAGNQIGVAPGARWIGCRNMDKGVGTPESYMECFQWFVAPTDLNGENPDPSKAPHVVNNSWSCPVSEGCKDPNILLDTVRNTVAAGILVVVSAGNSGPNCSTVSTPPAIYEQSFTVGSTTMNDMISGFSSRGPVTIDGSNRLKPDISAPGENVRSSVPVNAYFAFSGTSMAGPHVAGLAALMISADPELAGDPAIMRTLIQNRAVHLTGAQTCGGVSGDSIPNNTFGYGRIDAAASVSALPEVIFRQGFEITP